jgi:3-methyladenine DNA glycosylase AlkD
LNLIKDEWTNSDYIEFIEYLKSQADEKYRKFHSSLVPTAKSGEILGVRVPKLREISKEICKGSATSFLRVSKPDMYEERMMRGLVISRNKTQNFQEFCSSCDAFSEEINSWAVCDTFCSSLKEVKKYKKEFFPYLLSYLESGNDWKIRFALVIMLDYYLEDEYIDEVLSRCDSIKSDYYYVSMAQAWLVATAVAKCRDKAMAYLLNNSLDNATFNKAIQKCVESRRIDEKTKEFLNSLKKH